MIKRLNIDITHFLLCTLNLVKITIVNHAFLYFIYSTKDVKFIVKGSDDNHIESVIDQLI